MNNPLYLLERIVEHTKAREMRSSGKMEYVIPCPGCGKQSKPGEIHFSFGERGGFCFVCGYKCNLEKLADDVGLSGGKAYTYKPEPKRERIARVIDYNNYNDLMGVYELHPQKYTLWNTYKPITMELIFKYHLGVGKLPASKCEHERLVVPIIGGGKVLGFRGRAINCECKKWTASAGLTLDMLPLYNAENIQQGDVVMIVENAVDAILVSVQSADDGVRRTGVATFSTAYWRDAWGELLKAKRPKGIIVMFDNDLPGNGGALKRDAMIAEWKEKHGDKIPQARGIILANKLTAMGLAVKLYDWKDAKHKTDVGELIKVAHDKVLS